MTFSNAQRQNWWPVSWWQHIRPILNGRMSHLPLLAEVIAGQTVVDHVYTGRQTVPLSQIHGSATQARSRDFDADFRLLSPHNADRWQNIAAVCRRGKKLPPVALIEVGGLYFVEDGHHRISVAKADGWTDIEAEVTVLHMTGTMPRKKATGVYDVCI